MDERARDALVCLFWIIVVVVACIWIETYETKNTSHTDAIGEIVDVQKLSAVLYPEQLVIKVDGEIARIKFSEDFRYLHTDEIQIGKCVLLDKATYATNSYSFKAFIPCPQESDL